MMSGEFEILEVKNDRTEVETSRGHKIIINLLLLFLVDVLWVMATELTKYLFTVEGYDKPFLTSYIRSSCLVVHLLVAAWLRRPWRDKTPLIPEPTANGDDYTVIDPVAEDDNFYTDTINLSLSDATFVPLRNSTGGENTSGTESEHEQQHKRTVRFSRVAEVRALSGPNVACRMAAAARLSWPASRRAAAAAQRRRAAVALRRIASQAAKATPLYVAAQCLWSWWIHAAADNSSGSTCAWAWLGASGVTLGVTLTAVVVRMLFAMWSITHPTSSSPNQSISSSGAVTQITALLAVAVVALSVLLWSGLGSCLSGRTPLVVGASAFMGGLLYALFVCVRSVHSHPASHPHARTYMSINMHLFLGGIGVMSLLCWWWVVAVAALSGIEPAVPPTRRQLLLIMLDALLGNVLLDTLILRVCSMSAAVCTCGTLPLLLLSHWFLSRLHHAGEIATSEIVTGILCAVTLCGALLLLVLSAGRDPVHSALMKAKRVLLHTRTIRLAMSDSEQTEALIEGASSSPDDDHES